MSLRFLWIIFARGFHGFLYWVFRAIGKYLANTFVHSENCLGNKKEALAIILPFNQNDYFQSCFEISDENLCIDSLNNRSFLVVRQKRRQTNICCCSRFSQNNIWFLDFFKIFCRIDWDPTPLGVSRSAKSWKTYFYTPGPGWLGKVDRGEGKVLGVKNFSCHALQLLIQKMLGHQCRASNDFNLKALQYY